MRNDLPISINEENLDPQDWPAFRRLAHELLERALDYQQTVRERPVWQPLPAAVAARFDDGPPIAGAGIEDASRDALEQVLPYPTGNIHPRFWGWVAGTGTPSAIVAGLLGGALNAICGNFDDASSRVEAQVLSWMKKMLGLSADAGGVITSGCSVANLIGLAVARDAALAGTGMAAHLAAGGGRLVLYASEEVHASVDKAAMVLGLGRDALRRLPVDDGYRLRPAALEEAIARDRAAGLRPFAVVANAGTVNTGAIDNLVTLRRITRRQGLWLHVDGAFGAMAALSPSLRGLVRGMEQADSLAFDFHKWMYVPYEAGCILVRDAEAMRKSFRVGADYLQPLPRGIAAQADSTNHRGVQLSRGFNALKVWLHIKEHGFAKLGRMVLQNVEQARYLGGLIAAAADLELLAPVGLNAVCFRFAPAGLDEPQLEALNRELLMRLQERGIAVPSSTFLGGRFALRVVHCNQRSRRADFDLLVRETVRLGRELLAEDGAGVGAEAMAEVAS